MCGKNALGNTSLKHAWLMDTLNSERAQGITMKNKYVDFSTDKYSFTFIDSPGHRDFFKVATVGLSQGDCGIVVVSSVKE